MWLKRLDCWVTDKWTGRDWMYYSKVLGLKQRQYGGSIPWSVHFGQAFISRFLDLVDPGHCQRAITAATPKDL